MHTDNNIDRAQHITPQEFLARLGGAPKQVRAIDLELSQLGPTKTLTTPPMSSIDGDIVSLRIGRGALTAVPPKDISATSPTGGVAITIEPQGGGAPGAASKVHVNIALEPLIGGSLDHRTVYLFDQHGARLLALRIPLSDGAKPVEFQRPTGGTVGLGVPAPFSEKDSHNGRNQVLSPGQEFVVVLKDNPTTGRRWADKILDNSYFELLDSSFHLSGEGVGGGGSRVYRFRVKDDALAWHQKEKAVPAALSIYRMAPGESFEERTTRGDGSGPEFYLNTVIVREQNGRAHQVMGS